MEYWEWFYPGGMIVNWVIHPGIIEQELSNIPSTNGQKTLDNPTIRVRDIPGISQTNFAIHPRTKESLKKTQTLRYQGYSLTLSYVNEAKKTGKGSNFCWIFFIQTTIVHQCPQFWMTSLFKAIHPQNLCFWQFFLEIFVFRNTLKAPSKHLSIFLETRLIFTWNTFLWNTFKI